MGRNHSPAPPPDVIQCPPAEAAATGSVHGGSESASFTIVCIGAAEMVAAAKSARCSTTAAGGGVRRKTWISVDGNVVPELPGNTARRLSTAGPVATALLGIGTTAEIFAPASTCRTFSQHVSPCLCMSMQLTSLLYANRPSMYKAAVQARLLPNETFMYVLADESRASMSVRGSELTACPDCNLMKSPCLGE